MLVRTFEMTHGQGAPLIRTMLFAAQRARSVILETVSEDDVLHMQNTERFLRLPITNKWLVGKYNVIPALAQLVDRLDGGGSITVQEAANMVQIAQWEPAIEAMMPIDGIELPSMEQMVTLRKWSDQ